MNGIKTYPEMNETIKDLLRRNDDPMHQYILARIEEMEEQADSITNRKNAQIAEKANRHGGIDHLVALDDAAKDGILIILPTGTGTIDTLNEDLAVAEAAIEFYKHKAEDPVYSRALGLNEGKAMTIRRILGKAVDEE